jgi:PTH1 family peptidyl-tRNA hydrolase
VTAHQLSLVVGLGNPGSKYDGTRHNIGFMALERLAKKEGFSFRQQAKLHGLAADTGFGDQRLRLLMPQTFMNDSGRSVRAALDWYGFQPEDIVVLVDDMDLPLGRLRLRAQGSAGGHNGLRSTIQQIHRRMQTTRSSHRYSDRSERKTDGGSEFSVYPTDCPK